MRRVRELRDGLTNLMSGAGTAADKRAHGVYALRHADPAQIEAAYRSSWLMRKVVDLPPQDETRGWRRWQAGAAEIAAIEAEERRLNLRHKLRRARVLARLFGGGAILLGVGADDPAMPLDPARTARGALRYAHVLSRWELGHGAKRLDPEDPWFGSPEHFTLRGTGRAEVRIHPSRVVAFVGQPIPEASLVGGTSWFWGDPLMQSIEDAVKNADAAQNGFAALIEEAKVDVFEIIDSIVVRVVADVDEAQRKVAAYGEAAEEAFTRAQKATDVGDARLAQSVAGRRAAYRELGQQISQITTEAINGGNAFALLGQHGIETAATLEKFGGTVGRIGSILSGPWGVAVQLAVSVLGQLAGKLLENDQNADAAAAAMGRFQQQQSDIGRFIDLTTGKIKEQNRTLVRNGILTTQGEIDQRNKEAKFKRDEAFDAVRALAEPSTHGTFLQRLGPFATGFYTYDRELQAILRKAGGDIVKLDGLLAELTKKRPLLGAVATQVSNAAGLQIDAAQKNAKDELLIRALGGDDAALAELVRALRGSRPNSPAPVGSTVASVVSQRSITSAVASPSGHSPELSPTELRAGAADALEDIEAAIRVTVVPQPSLREIEEAVLEAVAAASPIDLDAFTIIDTEQLEKVAKISAMLSDDLAKGLTNAIISGKSLGDVLVDSFARAGQALIQSKIVQLLDPNGDGAAGFVGTANKVFGTIFAAPRPPRRASGGHVSAGQLYRVNEAGIEGFRPAGSGTIVPLGRMAAARPGGGVTVMQPLNVSFSGAITTPELMAEFKAYADGVGQAAAIGGAAMAQSRMARRAARTLPR